MKKYERALELRDRLYNGEYLSDKEYEEYLSLMFYLTKPWLDDEEK